MSLAECARGVPVGLLENYRCVRERTLELVRGFSAEDLAAQSMRDASPAKWHLAHTSWFFEAMILSRDPDYQPFDERFQRLFNSYYEALGERIERCDRGLITRPSVNEVLDYRAAIDARMVQRLAKPLSAEEVYLLDLGLNHEQQHQELLVQDLVHLFSLNPIAPAGWPHEPRTASLDEALYQRVLVSEGLYWVGGEDGGSFVFDNEMPRHRQWVSGFELSSDLVTNAEWLSFIEDGGYSRPELWLSDGWATVKEEAWSCPLYWHRGPDGQWMVFSATGLQPLEPSKPVRHISYYEADAFARWAKARLPTEAEWETAARQNAQAFSNLDSEVWQWTASAYGPYPGFTPTQGTACEYNGKFMANQMVLRGGSFATPRNHVRSSYRNFYYPDQRWALTGVRLAYDVKADDETTQLFRHDLIAGLTSKPKTVSPKWFYDEAGSRLFEDITRVEAYYPTRQEASLLRQTMPEWSRLFGPDAVLVEFGSGASEKTRIVLDAAHDLAAYVPLDISETALQEAAVAIRRDYPALNVVPVVGDFENLPPIPDQLGQGRRIGFFPGSTIGNLDEAQAVKLLRSAREVLGDGGYFILGVDLIKDPAILVRAYDDPQGVTANFNKNLLVRANRELGADFDLEAFAHKAVWNNAQSRMEMHLEALKDTNVHIGDTVIHFDAGETIHTESSRKYDEARLRALAAQSGWAIKQIAISEDPSVALVLMT